MQTQYVRVLEKLKDIVEENERLKRERNEESEKVDALREIVRSQTLELDAKYLFAEKARKEHHNAGLIELQLKFQ